MLENLTHHYLEPIRSFNRPARLFLLMTLIDGVTFSGWQLFFNFYILQSGYNRDFLGLVNSMPALAGLLLGIPLGHLSDRIGRKASLFIGLLLASVFMLAQITLRGPTIIVASAFLFGVFNMLLIISQAPLMVKLSNVENRTMLFSLNFGLLTLAGAVGNLFAGQLPAIFGRALNVVPTSAGAYQAVLIMSVLLGSLALVPLLKMEEPVAAPAPEVSPGASANPMPGALTPAGPKWMTLKMAIPQILIGFGAAILIPYMNVFYKDRFLISDSSLGLLFSLSALMIGVASLVGPRLATLMGGKVRAIVATQFSSLIFLLVMGFVPIFWLSAIGYLMRTALMNMSAPLYNAFCMERTPEHRQGFVNSILNLSWNVGWAVGPFISGLVQQSYGFQPLFVSTALLYFTAIVVQWKLFVGVDSAAITPAPVLAMLE
jgi:MFS family permease